MNYRHQFHAGNFADVMKHALLVQLVRAMQRKEKGLLYLDTHAGRGSYDLAVAAAGASLARQPEWPDGIGRLAERADLPAAVADYVGLAHEFLERADQLEHTPRCYPGSPWFAQQLMRPQDRVALCEWQAVEYAALAAEFRGVGRVSVHEMDGYAALRAMLPPPERRALVLIDPPYEAVDERVRIAAALGEGLRRLPAGVFAVWYPLTQRARVDGLVTALVALPLPPTLVAELAIAGEGAPMKMRGCGLAVLNPPWQWAREARTVLEYLARVLAQAPGAGARVEWLVAEAPEPPRA